jgi:hypothetical protein
MRHASCFATTYHQPGACLAFDAPAMAPQRLRADRDRVLGVLVGVHEAAQHALEGLALLRTEGLCLCGGHDARSSRSPSRCISSVRTASVSAHSGATRTLTAGGARPLRSRVSARMLSAQRFAYVGVANGPMWRRRPWPRASWTTTTNAVTPTPPRRRSRERGAARRAVSARRVAASERRELRRAGQPAAARRDARPSD